MNFLRRTIVLASIAVVYALGVSPASNAEYFHPRILQGTMEYPIATHASCDGVIFPLDGWKLQGDEPLVQGIDVRGHTLALDLPRAKLFFVGTPPKVDFILTYEDNGRWRLNRRGSCSVRASINRTYSASWGVISTSGVWLRASVYESGNYCRDTSLNQSVRTAQLKYTPKSLSVRFLAFPKPRRSYCHLVDNEDPTTFDILLPKPVGDRILLDGGSFPEVPAPKAKPP